jgi:hypothetical protein
LLDATQTALDVNDHRRQGMGLLNAHMDSVEAHLLAISQVPANSGHSLHKGTPREAFIREYLQDHLTQNLAIGTGEIIDARSQPNEPRNQIDIVLYRRDYPRLSFGGGISGFLAESVIATIEVKSVLTSEELGKSIRSARRVKQLEKSLIHSFHAGWVPPSILSYVLAYDGPTNMKTVHGWIDPLYQQEGIQYPALGVTGEERSSVASPALDGVFVLGRGFVQFDNIPIGYANDDVRRQLPGLRWIIGNTPRGALLLLFLCLTAAASGTQAAWLNPGPYLSDYSLPQGVDFVE